MFNNFEITKREILVSIVIILTMLGLGFFIADSIHSKVTEDSEKYFKALKVDNDPNLFDYAIRTEVGDVLSYGKFKANEPVSDKLIKGKYFTINKTEEHYTMHTRTVSYKCGKSTCTRTETYWTWDYYDDETISTKTFNYLGKDFDYNKINFNNYKYKETVKTSSHVRFVFDVIPIEFNGTLFAKHINKTITDTNLYTGENIKKVITEKEHSADNWVIVFWISWVLLIAIIVVIFVALDNRYINNE